MVIALSGVHFGLKLYAWFQNRTSAQYDLRSKLHDPKFNYHFIRSILKSHNLIAKYKNCKILVTTHIYWTKLPNLPNNGSFVFHFSVMWLVSLKKPSNLIGCFVLLPHFHWLRKRCDLEQKIVRFVNKSHRWEPITLQGHAPQSYKCL